MNAELDANFAAFEVRWKDQWATAEAAMSGEPSFARAFRRLVAMQAWRSELLEERLSSGSLQFALEGQNDLLVAYLFARCGQWRSALQSQRAAIENYLNCLYFMDHPVELQLWSNGQFKSQFSELFTYFRKHPKNNTRDMRFSGLDIIKTEYAILSKAVHGSAEAFRMSSEAGPNFFSNDSTLLMKWEHRNRQVIRGLCLLMLSLFRDDLVATRKRNLRDSISLAFRSGDKSWIKREFNVTVPF